MKLLELSTLLLRDLCRAALFPDPNEQLTAGILINELH